MIKYLLIPLIFLYLPIRDYNQSADPKVNDVNSHLAQGFEGSVHEATHQINSDLRGIYKRPCFYLMNDLVVALEKDPEFKLGDIDIPREDRGKVYRLYVVESQRWWDEQPSYLLDELVAYSNDGSNQSALKELIIYTSAMGMKDKENIFLKNLLIFILNQHSSIRIKINDNSFRDSLNRYYGKEVFTK
jgi:hypothetical protein